MTRTFLVAINVPDDFADPVAYAQEIEEDLAATHDVVEVRMWVAPTLATATPPIQSVPPMQSPVL